MKKLMILLGCIFLFASIDAQHDMVVPDGVNYASYTGVATDTVYGAGGSFDIVFYIKQAAKSRYTVSHLIDGDTITACTGDATIQVAGSYDGVTFTNIGSAITWSSSSAVYCANVNLHAMTASTAAYVVTDSIADITTAYNILANDSMFEDEVVPSIDTFFVPQITKSIINDRDIAAQTQTLNYAGVDYRYIRILITGASGTKAEIDKVAIKVTPVRL